MTDSYVICVRVEDDHAADVPTVRLREAIAQTLRQYGPQEETGLTLLVTDDATVRRLNARFRGVDAPTDVLSFPSGDDESPCFLDEPYLGDILIAYPYAAAEAAAEGHPLEHALMLLAVHGTLHLLGFDHNTPENQAAMWAAQGAVLQALDVPTDVIPPPHEFPAKETPHD